MCSISLIATLLFWPALCHAQDSKLGKELYDKHCLVCHGASGKGGGPLAKTTLQKVTDITLLKKKSKDVLPYDYLHRFIDGRETSDAHGPRDMPHWGLFYADEAKPGLAQQEFVRERIDALIAHIDKLQEK